MSTINYTVHNQVGVIRLNAPKSLNSLGLEMILSMQKILDRTKADPSIKCLIFESEGEKAFCAGGDVVSLYKSMIDKTSYGTDFFKLEYSLDLSIHQYPKPIIAFAKGITMGGGIGISVGASFRLVTPSTKMAMPEITIGLFTDVGATHFLNNVHPHVGKFVALTGCRLNPADCLFLKLADSFVLNEQLQEIKSKILDLNWSGSNQENYNILSRTLHPFIETASPSLPISNLQENLSIIKEITQHQTIEELDSHWRKLDLSKYPEFISKSLSTYFSGSPTSAAVIFEQLNRGAKGISIEQALQMELIMAHNFTRAHDFKEGVRALLIDKDAKPNWQPRLLSEISQQQVQEYFHEGGVK